MKQKEKQRKNSAVLGYLGGQIQERVEVDLAPCEVANLWRVKVTTLKHFSNWEKPKFLRARKKLNRRFFQLDYLYGYLYKDTENTIILLKIDQT